jgi:hypothetical protein
MVPIIIMVIVAEVLHRWLGWQLWIGVAIVCGVSTGPPILRLLADTNLPMALRISTALQAIGGMLIAAGISYVAMVTMHYWMHTPSW